MDTIEHFILNDELSVLASDTTQLVARAKELHQTFPTSTAALGRVLTAAVMMGSSLKGKNHKLTLSLEGRGPAGTVMATANALCEVKGCIGNPQVDLPAKADGQLDVGRAIGRDGFCTVIRDIGLKEPYIGRSPLATGEVAEDLATYFLRSEQQPSIVYLSAWVDIDTKVLRSGGLIIAPLPGASEETLAQVEKRLPKIGNYALALLSGSPKEAVGAIFEGMTIKHLASAYPRYECDCSRERIERIILSLGETEIREMLQQDAGAEVVCRFCNKNYRFSAEELETLLSEATRRS